MRALLLLLLLIIFHEILYSQIATSLSGTIRDKQTGQALPGASVTIKGSFTSIVANVNGYFSFPKIKPGEVILIISYVGYELIELPAKVYRDRSTFINAWLALDDRVGNEVVVAASKRPEKITHAPASVQVIGIRDLQQFSGSNVGELASKIQGVEFVRSGVDFVAFNARGFNRAINNKFFQMIDRRNTMSPLGPGLPLVNLATAIKEDIESIEIILGPQSALFGPNVHNGLFSITTKHPRKYPGTTVSVSAGNRLQLSTRFRHATQINNRWAYKLSGEYSTGKDFNFYDSVYAGGGAFGPMVAIPERNVDFNFKHIRGEAHVYYNLTSNTEIIISGGGANNNFIGVSNVGRNQMKGLGNNFLQIRAIHPNFLLNIYNAWATFGDSYSIAAYTRDFWNITHGNPPLSDDLAEKYAMRNKFKEQSQRLNAESQYNYTFKKAGIMLVAGLSYQKEKPNSFGNGLVDSAARIYVTQVGTVLQLEKSLPWRMRLVGATRFDNHSNYGNFFSPKFAWLKNSGEGTFRIMWAKAYAMPGILFQYGNTSGLIFGNGPGITYIPNFSKINERSYIKTKPLEPEQVSTWELGYKGSIIKKLYLDINLYYGVSTKFLGPAQSVGGRIVAVGSMPVTHNPAFAGTVVNDTLYNASFSTFFNYGQVRAYGVDVGLNYLFNNVISFAVKYSWFGSNITDNNFSNDANKNGYISSDEKSLNAPKNKGVATVTFKNLLKQRMSASVSVRFVEQYDFYTGNQIGTAAGKGKRGLIDQGPGRPPLMVNFDHGALGGFSTIDLSTRYKMNKMVAVNIGITNLFNTNQPEFVGSPSIGRLIMFEVSLHMPNRAR
ncbi:MAG TPA: TonB-dependent receptor [Flavitalea sp.]|nr:TonB-dependent receptor [Flavitalea sp.]